MKNNQRSLCDGILQIQPDTHVYEGELEQALIDHLQHFLLELGRGFSFVARQKRFTLDGQDFSST